MKFPVNRWVIRTKWVRPLVWKAIRALPKFLRYEIIRRFFPISPELPAGLEFKLAETREELEAAYALLYDEYLACRFVDENPAGMRITKYHALPGTAVLIGKSEGQVICTLTVFQDSPLGLPIDTAWNIDSLRKGAPRIAEISALAIRRDSQGRRGQILLPFCKFMYEYCTRYAGIDVIVVSTIEAVKDFYLAILLFEPVGDGKPVRYKFVKNVSATAQFLDLRTAPERYKKVYGGKEAKQDLYRWFTSVRYKQFLFPKKVAGQCVYPTMTPELLDYFFQSKLPIFSSLSDEEKRSLKALYFYQPYREVIDPASSDEEPRSEPRYATDCTGTLLDPAEARLQSIKIIEISASGFAAKLGSPLVLGRPVLVNMKIDDEITLKIDAIPVWNDAMLRYGFQIIRVSSEAWRKFVDVIEATYALDVERKRAG